MSISRNQENYIIMTVIYEALLDNSVHPNQVFRSFEELVNNDSVATILSSEDEEIEEVKSDDFIKNSVNLSLSHYADVVNMINPHLKNWTWDRIPLLSRAILLMSVAHFYYVEKIDKRIVIDVAINLAKKYIEEKQAKFIHAILDEVIG